MKSEITYKDQVIVAIATPPGRGGIGVIRISGKLESLAVALVGRLPPPRRAVLTEFYTDAGELIDAGLVLYFPAPHSFTGESVLELQVHGSPMAMKLLVQRVVALGARLAEPGEFSQRAYLNGQLDLVQAEAIADLIASRTAAAARAAAQALRGDFSQKIDGIFQQLTDLRVYLEATLDFSEEELDFLENGALSQKFAALAEQLAALKRQARQGQLLRDGFHVAIVGQPNAGKSSLLNALIGQDRAMVNAAAGTTRDVIYGDIHLDGALPVQLCDTAGLRDGGDELEQEGIQRAYREMAKADLLLVVCDGRLGVTDFERQLLAQGNPTTPVVFVQNKIDLLGIPPKVERREGAVQVWLSAKTAQGIELLCASLKEHFHAEPSESPFIANQRHVDALDGVERGVARARSYWNQNAAELVAEELRIAQDELGKITGKFTNEDLLGRIFSRFCIGK